MIARATPRGQPLLVLGLVLGGWVLLRAALWDAPAAPPHLLNEMHGGVARQTDILPIASSPVPAFAVSVISSPGWSIRAISAYDIPPGLKQGRSAPSPASGSDAPASPIFASGGLPVPGEVPPNPLPHSPRAAPFQPPRDHPTQPSVKRWSGEAWLLLRGDGAGNLAAGRGSYGASQGGAVLRFSILPDSPLRPAIYLRASKAISGAKEAEGALGFSARPVAALPLRAAAELRVSETNGQVELRPAAYIVTELPPAALPLAFRGEAYAQGGYVWGSYPSAFVDGHLRIDRPVATLGRAEIRAGGGVWGGAQKGAERLDVGPGATLAFDAGRTNARVSVDWRQRIAGDARPVSGPALTVAVGF